MVRRWLIQPSEAYPTQSPHTHRPRNQLKMILQLLFELVFRGGIAADKEPAMATTVKTTAIFTAKVQTEH
jgi:hypothetical protein